MTVWIVLVSGRINSAWTDEARADAHKARLRQVNGDQLAISIVGLEVRE